MKNNNNHKILTLANNINELSLVKIFLEKISEEWHLSARLISHINLALEEAVVNIINYGYYNNEIHEIKIEIIKNTYDIIITIIDDGHEFNPTLKITPNISIPAENREIGGLGILLIKSLMNKIDYQRKENKNHLILTIKIE